MSRFNLNEKPVGGGKGPSTKLPTGKYKVRLEKMFVKPSEERSGENFIAEFTVLEVLSGGKGEVDKHGNIFPDTKANDYRSWALYMGHKNSGGNLNEFLAAVNGTDPRDPEALKAAEIDFDELLEEALDSKNEMRGIEVVVTTGLKETKNKSHFMAYSWSCA